MGSPHVTSLFLVESAPVGAGPQSFGVFGRALFSIAKTMGPRDEDDGRSVQVLVRDNNVEQALRALKKKMQREGIFREMRLHDHYEKPSEKRTREKAESIRRARKLARKRAQREGLLPTPPKRSAPPGRVADATFSPASAAL